LSAPVDTCESSHGDTSESLLLCDVPLDLEMDTESVDSNDKSKSICCTDDTYSTHSLTTLDTLDSDDIISDDEISTGNAPLEHMLHMQEDLDAGDTAQDMKKYASLEDAYEDNMWKDICYVNHTPKTSTKSDDIVPVVPCTILRCATIGSQSSKRILRCLLDSGSTRTLIHRSCIPRNVEPKLLAEKKKLSTLAGQVVANSMVYMRDIRLPEFDKNRSVEQQKTLVFDQKCNYDVILGSDFLTKAGINLLYEDLQMKWLDLTLPMRSPSHLDNAQYVQMYEQYKSQQLDEYLGEEWLDAYLTTQIKDAKYEKADIRSVVDLCPHLTESQKDDLYKLLKKHEKLFDGTLGVYPHKKVHIEIEENAEPVHARAYPVPRIHLETFKKELQHLVKIGVLSPQGCSEWASPTFIIPKKDGRVRWISDLRALNKVIKRRQYPLPIINEILRKRPGYEFFTKLDISMQYYTFELDEESKDLCTIVTPFGKFKYNRLPMGLRCSPDIAQEVMENVLRNIEEIDVYIDDVGVFNNDWQGHLQTLDEVLRRLKDNGFTINPLKCEWAVKETDWLGYWLTPRGLKPWKKKVEAILALKKPTNIKQLRGVIGLVNYYKDLWPRRAHTLKPLTDMTGKKSFIWTPEMDKAFEEVKKLVSAAALCAYPDHNKRFVIETDASDYQMGAIIKQEDDNGLLRPVAYFSQKFNKAQLNYSTRDQELLSIVMVLKKFRTMLLGAQLDIYTDHKNLTFDNLNSQRVLRWRTFVEEYSPTLHYIPGPENVVADALSRLDREDPVLEPQPASTVEEVLEDAEDLMFISFGDTETYECIDAYLNLPELDTPTDNPLNLEWIREKQQEDTSLLEKLHTYPERYMYREFDDDINIICHVKPGDDAETQWKIALAQNMLQPTIEWYHTILGHPGSKRLRMALECRYYHMELRRHVDRYHCDACRRHKLDGPGWGLLPERDMKEMPFEEVAVDLIGPWTIKVAGRVLEFNALTCIDPVTNLVELVRIDRKTSQHIRDKFEQTWLSRYPWPTRCIHDLGGEFIGHEFQLLLERCSIKDVPTTSKNPQSNAICERMHQTVANILRTVLYTNPPRTVGDAKAMIDSALATAMHAMRTNVATTLQSSPGALVFNRDMFHNVPLVADWHMITQAREHHVNENLRRQNRRRRRYDYAVDQQVLKKVFDPTKLGPRTTGPYTITRVHANGNVTMRIRPGVLERINIRRILPYRITND